MTERLTQEMLDQLIHELRTQDSGGADHPVYHVVNDPRDEWEVVNVHLTKRAAETYIAEHEEELWRPIVEAESQWNCHEWNAVRIALMEGRLKLVGDGDVRVDPKKGVKVSPVDGND